MSAARILVPALSAVAAAGLVLTAAAPAAAQSDADVVVTNRETVQAFLDTKGELDVARVYDQIDVVGTGDVRLENPVSTQNLRNLEGFGAPDTVDGAAIQEFSVDGEARLRTVSDFDGELPVSITPRYLLDGEVVDAGDLVGASGTVEVRYTVENITSEPTEVTFTDGSGEEVTREIDVPIPLVGQLVTVLPGSFTEVRSGEATVSGDGRGGTRLSFTMTLFPPISSTTAEFGWTAQTTDGSLAPATVSIAPVKPLESPSFRGAAESYKGGAETGAQLTDGAMQIDSNLLRLRDGAAELLSGLIQLRDGAEQLAAGLQGEAAPGADQLAAGAQQAADGADELAAGLGRLDAGAGELSSGATQVDTGAEALSAGAVQLRDGLLRATAGGPALLDGLNQVADGLGRLDGGLAQLSAAIGGLDTDPGVNQLRQGIQQIIAGIGTNTTAETLLYGLARTDGGLRQLQGELSQAEAGIGYLYQQLGCGTPIPGTPFSTCTKVDPTSTSPNPSNPAQQIPTGVLTNNTLADVRAGAADGVAGIGEFGTDETLLDAVNRVRCGLDNTTRGTNGCGATPDPGVLQGMVQIQGGLELLIDTVIASVQGAIGTPQTDPSTTLRGGVAALRAGVGKLQAGGSELSDGLDKLAAGSETLASGAGRLEDGTGRVSAGAGQLAAGTGEAEAGASRLADGNEQIADGARELSEGLDTAADGSGQLSDGLGQASEGAPQIVDGAERLSAEGTSQLVAAGNETALDFGERFAAVEAATVRAQESAMPYGAPEDAIGTAAYSIEIAGADGEGTRNLGRGLLALVIFGGVAALAFVLRRAAG